MTLQLGSKERIADVPILQVRDLLMRSGGSFREDWLTDKGMPKQVCGELVNLGYIAKSSDPCRDDKSGFSWFDLTEQGRRFVRASAARRITRPSADRTVKALRERIGQINVSNEYMLRISEAVIFGSYAQNAETLGDIDFAYRSERKVDIFGSDSQWDLAARDDFYRCGRTAKTMLDELFWPDIKVRLYLKNRQRAISLHCMDEFLAIQRKSRSLFIVLVGDRKSICNDIVNSKLDFEVSC